MGGSSIHLMSLLFVVTHSLQFYAHGAPAGPLVKHLSSLLRWKRASSKAPQSDGNYLQFESGYLVETVVEGSQLGIIPHSMRVSKDGEIFAVDAINDNVVRISPPLSQYSRARLVAGSFEGYTGHVDGKPNEARFNRPKGVTVDDKGNVYVADTANLAIRKIGEGGVTTIAGGKSNVAGYRDGPSEHAMFSNDFDVVYVPQTCSLLVIDRGNAALRRISLNQDDCDSEDNSISATDVIMVLLAISIGYAFGMLRQGLGPSPFPRTCGEKNEPDVSSSEEHSSALRSFVRLMTKLSKPIVTAFFYLLPPPKGLTPLKDTLKIPEDEPVSSFAQRQRVVPLSINHARLYSEENLDKVNSKTSTLQKDPFPSTIPQDEYVASLAHKQRVPPANSHTNLYSEENPNKVNPKPSAVQKDPPLPTKYISTKLHGLPEYYGRSELPPASKSSKEKARRRRNKHGEPIDAVRSGSESKPVGAKIPDYEYSNYRHGTRKDFYDGYRG